MCDVSLLLKESFFFNIYIYIKDHISSFYGLGGSLNVKKHKARLNNKANFLDTLFITMVNSKIQEK